MRFSKRLAKLHQAGLLARLAIVVAPLLLLAIVVVPIGYLISGPSGFAACSIAFVACLAGGLLSSALGMFFKGPGAALQELLIGMLFRMGVPLGIALLVITRFPALQDAGFVFYLVPFFLVGLAMHASVAVAELQAQQSTVEVGVAESSATGDSAESAV